MPADAQLRTQPQPIGGAWTRFAVPQLEAEVGSLASETIQICPRLMSLLDSGLLARPGKGQRANGNWQLPGVSMGREGIEMGSNTFAKSPLPAPSRHFDSYGVGQNNARAHTHARATGVLVDVLDEDQIRRLCCKRQEPETSRNRNRTVWTDPPAG